MRLLPQDLGTKWHILTVRNRALGVAAVWTKPVEPRLGELGKRWIKDLPVTEEVAAATLPLTADTTNGYTYGFGLGAGWMFPAMAVAIALSGGHWLGIAGQEALTVAAAGAYGYGVLVGLPRNLLKKLHGKALTEEELVPFLTGNVPGLPHVFGEMAGKLVRFLQRQAPDPQAQQDELERAFLLLVRDVLRSQNVPKESEDELRDALRSIGEALCRLPAAAEIENVGSSILAADQRDEARMMYARAERESDPIIAGSLRRQAEALEAAAQASENGTVVARRVRALRSELRAQIDVLRLTLPTWGRPSTTHTDHRAAHSEQSLSRIAESVRSVAQEADAVSAAQDELDDFVNGKTTHTSTYTYSTNEPKQQTLRAR